MRSTPLFSKICCRMQIFNSLKNVLDDMHFTLIYQKSAEVKEKSECQRNSVLIGIYETP